MGRDHSLSCRSCKEKLLNVARNNKLNKDKDSLELLQTFLNKHADHDLVFDADDDWVRVANCTIFER